MRTVETASSITGEGTKKEPKVNEAAEKGFFGIGIVAGKTAGNIGTLWRSAYQLGASFTFTIGARHAKFKREFIVLYHLTFTYVASPYKRLSRRGLFAHSQV